jgi:hypothetical protein
MTGTTTADIRVQIPPGELRMIRTEHLIWSGLDVVGTWAPQRTWSLNGEPITEDQARALIAQYGQADD